MSIIRKTSTRNQPNMRNLGLIWNLKRQTGQHDLKLDHIELSMIMARLFVFQLRSFLPEQPLWVSFAALWCLSGRWEFFLFGILPSTCEYPPNRFAVISLTRNERFSFAIFFLFLFFYYCFIYILGQGWGSLWTASLDILDKLQS